MTHRFIHAAARVGVLEVVINRPDKRNALSQAVLRELREVFDAQANDLALIAATLTGAGDKCFAAGGDMLMPCNLNRGVALPQSGAQSCKTLVLRRLKRISLQAFELNAYGKIVAVVAAAEVRLPRVPCALAGPDKLPQLTISAHVEMCGHLHVPDLFKVGVR